MKYILIHLHHQSMVEFTVLCIGDEKVIRESLSGNSCDKSHYLLYELGKEIVIQEYDQTPFFIIKR